MDLRRRLPRVVAASWALLLAVELLGPALGLAPAGAERPRLGDIARAVGLFGLGAGAWAVGLGALGVWWLGAAAASRVDATSADPPPPPAWALPATVVGGGWIALGLRFPRAFLGADAAGIVWAPVVTAHYPLAAVACVVAVWLVVARRRPEARRAQRALSHRIADGPLGGPWGVGLLAAYLLTLLVTADGWVAWHPSVDAVTRAARAATFAGRDITLVEGLDGSVAMVVLIPAVILSLATVAMTVGRVARVVNRARGRRAGPTRRRR